MSAVKLRQRQQLDEMERRRVEQLQMTEMSQRHLQLAEETISDERKRSAAEIEGSKASALLEHECVNALFLAAFENFCNNKEMVEQQKTVLEAEYRTRELQEILKQERKKDLLTFASKATQKLSYCRMKLQSIVKIVTDQRDESQKRMRECEVSILQIIENHQRQHNLQMLGATSLFTDTLTAKDKEIRVLNESIGDKEACIMMLSEKLTMEQSDLTKARQQHDHDVLQISEMERSDLVAKQQVETLKQNGLHLQHENHILRESVNQELDTSARLKREANVMAENFRSHISRLHVTHQTCPFTPFSPPPPPSGIERENQTLQKLKDEQESTTQHLQDDLQKELAVSSQLKQENEKQKIETEAIKLMRDKLR